MPTYPCYLTYRPEELEAKVREIDRTGHYHSAVQLLTAPRGGKASGQERLLKSYTCPVSFPDGAEGTCAYTRGGPRWHIFRFTYGRKCPYRPGASHLLPVQYLTDRIGNDPASIEGAAKELASSAFEAAIRHERREYFGRASEGCGRRRQPERCQMKAGRARALAGRYALCRKVGSRLLPISGTFEQLDEANREWQAKGDVNIVVGCCNRLDRCWELPHFNTLYAEFDPRPAVLQEVTPEVHSPVGREVVCAGVEPEQVPESDAPLAAAPDAADDLEAEWELLPDADPDEDEDTWEDGWDEEFAPDEGEEGEDE